jgi:hypothetical protein
MIRNTLIIITALNWGCASKEENLSLGGKWVNTQCDDKVKPCKSDFHEIIIDPAIPDSILVKTKSGSWEKLRTLHKWQSFTLTLENGYQTLLYPNYKTQNLQYYDNRNKKFVYYRKSLQNN